MPRATTTSVVAACLLVAACTSTATAADRITASSALTPVAARPSSDGTELDPTLDPTRDGTVESGDAAFDGSVPVAHGGIAGLDESVTIHGDGRFHVTSEDVGVEQGLGAERLDAVAAALLDEFAPDA